MRGKEDLGSHLEEPTHLTATWRGQANTGNGEREANVTEASFSRRESRLTALDADDGPRWMEIQEKSAGFSFRLRGDLSALWTLGCIVLYSGLSRALKAI